MNVTKYIKSLKKDGNTIYGVKEGTAYISTIHSVLKMKIEDIPQKLRVFLYGTFLKELRDGEMLRKTYKGIEEFDRFEIFDGMFSSIKQEGKETFFTGLMTELKASHFANIFSNGDEYIHIAQDKTECLNLLEATSIKNVHKGSAVLFEYINYSYITTPLRMRNKCDYLRALDVTDNK